MSFSHVAKFIMCSDDDDDDDDVVDDYDDEDDDKDYDKDNEDDEGDDYNRTLRGGCLSQCCLWYAFHWWYTRVLQVVRRILFLK